MGSHFRTHQHFPIGKHTFHSRLKLQKLFQFKFFHFFGFLDPRHHLRLFLHLVQKSFFIYLILLLKLLLQHLLVLGAHFGSHPGGRLDRGDPLLIFHFRNFIRQSFRLGHLHGNRFAVKIIG